MILKLPDGKSKRLWGVSLYPEKRTLKEDAPDLAAWGEPWENVTNPYYGVRIFALGRVMHLGVRGTPQGAGRLYDSGLFHLWGFLKNPKPRFNELLPGQPAPALLPEVTTALQKLRLRCRAEGLDFDTLNFNFFQRNQRNQQKP